MIEFRIARRQVRAHRMRAVFRQQVDALALDAEIGAEITSAIHHVPGSLIEIGRSRMLHFGRAIAWPWQAEVIAIEHVTGLGILAAFCAQRLDVEYAHVAHVRLQPLR